MNSCAWIMPNDEPCGNITEGRTNFCSSHNRQLRKESENERKQSEKRALQLQKAREKSKEPRKKISKNPADWSNTFLCSDGTRVTQAQINERLHEAYDQIDDCFCKGCGRVGNSHAHIIAQARCKQIGKTELIWDRDNIFWSDFACNSAIENPKGKSWKSLKNIDKCLAFIKLHDPELYTKFELSAVNQEKPII